MIQLNEYRLVIAGIAYDAQRLVIKLDEGADLKEVNDQLIDKCRIGLELGLKFKGQEEAGS